MCSIIVFKKANQKAQSASHSSETSNSTECNKSTENSSSDQGFCSAVFEKDEQLASRRNHAEPEFDGLAGAGIGQQFEQASMKPSKADSVKVQMARTSINYKICVICDRSNREKNKLHRLPDSALLSLKTYLFQTEAISH